MFKIWYFDENFRRGSRREFGEKYLPNYAFRFFDVVYGLVFHLADADDSASLDKAEFEKFYNGLIRLFLFNFLDANENDSISAIEIYNMIKAATEYGRHQTMTFSQIVPFVQMFDSNGSGEIEYNEFEDLIKPLIDTAFMKLVMLIKYQGFNSESGYEDMFDKILNFI